MPDNNDDLEEYRSIVSSASRNKSNVPIPNSTEAHAKVLFEFMIPEAQSSINIFSGDFREFFYNDSKIENAFNNVHKKGVKIKVLLQRTVSETIKRKYKYIDFQVVEKSKFNNHFMVIDDSMYRFEREHDIGSREAEAIANFNDKPRAKILSEVFETLN